MGTRMHTGTSGSTAHDTSIQTIPMQTPLHILHTHTHRQIHHVGYIYTHITTCHTITYTHTHMYRHTKPHIHHAGTTHNTYPYIIMQAPQLVTHTHTHTHLETWLPAQILGLPLLACDLGLVTSPVFGFTYFSKEAKNSISLMRKIQWVNTWVSHYCCLLQPTSPAFPDGSESWLGHPWGSQPPSVASAPSLQHTPCGL